MIYSFYTLSMITDLRRMKIVDIFWIAQKKIHLKYFLINYYIDAHFMFHVKRKSFTLSEQVSSAALFLQ